jgi:hypothetical protein
VGRRRIVGRDLGNLNCGSINAIVVVDLLLVDQGGKERGVEEMVLDDNFGDV